MRCRIWLKQVLVLLEVMPMLLLKFLQAGYWMVIKKPMGVWAFGKINHQPAIVNSFMIG